MTGYRSDETKALPPYVSSLHRATAWKSRKRPPGAASVRDEGAVMGFSGGPRERHATSGWRARPICAPVLRLGACGESHGGKRELESDPLRIAGADAELGRRIIASIECGVRHRIPGVAGAVGIVGPPLDAFASRQFIAGVAPNQPWIQVQRVKDAPSIAPRTGMPELPLTAEEARHVAAYLSTLR